MSKRRSVDLRKALVERLVSAGRIRSAAVKSAFMSVPREIFVPSFARKEGLAAVYRDDAIPTRHDEAGMPISSSSQPAIMAEMLELLDVHPGHRVLEIGTGTGYNAALLARLVSTGARVVSIELDPQIAREARAAIARTPYPARVIAGDGRRGWSSGAPFDRIIVTASAEEIPPPWFDQLASNGTLVLPLRLGRTGSSWDQVVAALRKEGGRLVSTAVTFGGFMFLRPHPTAPGGLTPTLSADEALGPQRQTRSLGQLTGEALGTLSPMARQRLLALTLGPAVTSTRRVRAPASALALFLSLATPERVVGYRRPEDFEGIALLGGRGDELAALVGRNGHFTRVQVHGGRGTERELTRLIEEWNSLGRPAQADLRIRVDFAAAPRAEAWRKQRRGAAIFRFDWSRRPPGPGGRTASRVS
jgi:protein-L-isoaspartate(D-aspartate) O-methyltransferase